MVRITKEDSKLIAIKNLATAIAATTTMNSMDVKNLYKVSKKTALWNATATLLKMIGELK